MREEERRGEEKGKGKGLSCVSYIFTPLFSLSLVYWHCCGQQKVIVSSLMHHSFPILQEFSVLSSGNGR